MVSYNLLLVKYLVIARKVTTEASSLRGHTPSAQCLAAGGHVYSKFKDISLTA